ncbi:MAG: stage 0 sporulation protein [Nitrospirae bacterium]|nr:MAG: stage 0 sporulation protein [Nitrospirota bacterium]
MPDVVGIRFKNCGKVYDFDVNSIEVRRGDQVIVESEFGLSIGNVVMKPHPSETPPKELKKVVRVASSEDLQQKKDNETFEKEARSFCLERINARGIPMKLVCSEVTLDRKRIVFYFTADGRIDFRELVKDLAAKFKTRIEMRQIGVRDKAKLVGGLGICGKELCCRQFLTSFEPISIKMAKQQDLTLNTGKLSGICGRLMCCLGYEYSSDYTPRQRARAEEPAAKAESVKTAVEVDERIADIPCCLPETPPEPATVPQQPKQEEPKKAEEQGRKKRRRRRFRKRPPKNEQ